MRPRLPLDDRRDGLDGHVELLGQHLVGGSATAALTRDVLLPSDSQYLFLFQPSLGSAFSASVTEVAE